MILYITDRNIRVYNADNQISYNSDYIAEFVFDDEWNGKIKTARFIQDNEHFDVILVNDKCKIPPLKNGHIKIGVFTDSMTSTYADVYFKTSIKDGAGNPTEPPEDVYAQLTSLIESGILKGDDGLTPYVGENNNWWIGDIDTGILARGTDGEDGYTPVKGVDYFTEEEVQQIQNEVSGGAIGGFKAVVDEETATFNTNAENTLTGYNANAQEKFNTYNTNADSKFTKYNTNAEIKFSEYTNNADTKLAEYNQNDSDKTDLYNANAESKLDTYNSNAQAKFDLYNQNDSEKTEAYNKDAQEKLDAYSANAESKLNAYNVNDSEKTASYNANANSKFTAYSENADDRLSEYNQNADNRFEEFNLQAEQIQSQIDSKFEAYNTNAKIKFSEYNNNAESKVATYNQNDVAKTEAYNKNAQDKLNSYNSNAQAKLNAYNENAEQKLESYNSNHTEKLTEYNTNAETKTAEFDSNAAALQTEVDRLRGECDTLAAENRKQENRIDALIKLNKGQTYDILPEEGETASRTAPSGAKYVGVDNIGGKSVVWNQQPEYNTGAIISSQIDALEVRGKNLCPICTSPSKVQNGVNWHNNGDGTITATGVATDYTVFEILQPMTPIPNIIKGKIITISAGLEQKSNVLLSGFSLYDKSNKLVALTLSGQMGGSVDMSLYPNAEYMTFGVKRNNNIKVDALITPMIEVGPTATQYKSYSLQTIPTNFPVLNSAGSVYDYIDINEGKLHQRVGVVDLGTLSWVANPTGRFYAVLSEIAKPTGSYNKKANLLCNRYDNITQNQLFAGTKGIATQSMQGTTVYVYDSAYISVTPQEFITAMSGVMLYYELAEEIITDIEIPTELTDWLPVEAGGSVTFRNSDETKQLAVPNAVSWVRKLDEVT